MSYWGMGISQGDEYEEIYERFMESYDSGEEISNITQSILQECLSDFDPDDGVLHDVYFALAKCQWMCCALSDDLLKTVTEIITSGANIDFLRELGADESELKLRQKNLQRFLSSLQTPRKSPRKRNPPPKEKILPPAETGDVFRYGDGKKDRFLIILESFCPPQTQSASAYFCGIFQKCYEEVPANSQLLEEPIGILGIYTANQFVPKSKIKKCFHIDISEKLYNRLFGNILVLGVKSNFFTDQTDICTVSLRSLLNGCNDLSREDADYYLKMQLTGKVVIAIKKDQT